MGDGVQYSYMSFSKSELYNLKQRYSDLIGDLIKDLQDALEEIDELTRDNQVLQKENARLEKENAELERKAA